MIETIQSPFRRQSFVILGDSISTYQNWIPEQYECFYEGDTLRFFGLADVRDCWWYTVYEMYKESHQRKIAGVLNVSYSGALVTGNAFPAGQSYKRIKDIEIEQEKKNRKIKPGVIIVCMGYNDFGNNIPPRETNPIHCSFESAYYNMLVQLRRIYPSAMILCTTLLPTTMVGRPDWQWPEEWVMSLEQYNKVVRSVAKRVRKKCRVIDIAAQCSATPFETLDGIHPNKRGHRQIAVAFLLCLAQMGLVNWESVNELIAV